MKCHPLIRMFSTHAINMYLLFTICSIRETEHRQVWRQCEDFHNRWLLDGTIFSTTPFGLWEISGISWFCVIKFWGYYFCYFLTAVTPSSRPSRALRKCSLWLRDHKNWSSTEKSRRTNILVIIVTIDNCFLDYTKSIE